MRSIRHRLVLLLCSGAVVIVIAAGAALYWQVSRALHEEAAASLELLAGTIGACVEVEGGQLGFEAHAHPPTECDRPGGTTAYQVWRTDGTVLARSASLGAHDLARPASPAGAPRTFATMLPDGRPALARVTASTAEANAPGYSLVVARDVVAITATLAQLRDALLAIGLLAAAAVAFAVPLVVRRGLLPLDRLADRVAHLDAENLERTLTLETPPLELVPIVARLEELRLRLAASFAAERRFNAAVAHELRTPIAELRAMSEVALRWPDAQQHAATLQEALAIARQMEKVVATLLALRRGEDGVIQAAHTPVPLEPLLLGIARAQDERAAARGLVLQLAVPPDHALLTDPELLRAILTALVDNAVAHAPGGTAIACRSRLEDSHVHLTIANQAPELGPDDLPLLFEPFWRKDAARHDPDHSGLGLTLARTYARLLDLELRATLREGQLTLELTGTRAQVVALHS